MNLLWREEKAADKNLWLMISAVVFKLIKILDLVDDVFQAVDVHPDDVGDCDYT